MKYKNTKTGFVFDSPCVIKAEGWEILDPRPTIEEIKEKPVKSKRNKKDD